jgi:muramoyltetrapeptide carboxypeptidase
LQKPFALRPGDTIGIPAPSSPVPKEELEKGIAVIQARGYKVVLGKHVYEKAPTNDFLAGTDADRAADLNDLLTREDIHAVFCARGGYGAMRLWDRLNWKEIARHPKIVCGYSDITSLHLGLEHWCSLITFYGPNAGSLPRLDTVSADCFWRMVEKPETFGVFPADSSKMQTLVGGKAEGELAGGCLSLLAHACGSACTPDLRGKIVLIEDVSEASYRVDRYLTQLQNAGLLQQAAGFVVGTVTGWRKHEEEPPKSTPEGVWKDVLAPLGVPTIINFPFGHEPNPLTLPLGVHARLDADARTLTLLEPALQTK